MANLVERRGLAGVFLRDRNSCLIAVVFLIGWLLRLYNVTGRSLWYDEAVNVSFAQQGLSDMFWHRNVARIFYPLLLKTWMYFFGATELSVRLPSVLLGAFSILLVYKIARLLFDKETALLSACLAAFSSHYLYFSREALFYALLLFLSLFSMLYFIKMTRGERGVGVRLGYVLTNILLFYTHYAGFYVVLIQNITFFFLAKDYPKAKWLLHQCIFLAAAIPLLLFLRHAPLSEQFAHISHEKVTPVDLVETLETWAYGGVRQGHAGEGFAISAQRLVLPRALFLIGGIMAVHGIVFGRNKNHSVAFLLVWIFLPMAILYFFSHAFLYAYRTRYLMAASPGWYLLVAHGIRSVASRPMRNVTLWLTIFLSATALNLVYHPGAHESWREASFFIRKNIKSGDVILFAPIHQIVPFWYYYKQGQANALADVDRYGKRIDGVWKTAFFDDDNYVVGVGLGATVASCTENPALKKSIQENRPIWFVVSPFWPRNQEAVTGLRNLLMQHYVIREQKSYPYSGIFVQYLVPLDA